MLGEMGQVSTERCLCGWDRVRCSILKSAKFFKVGYFCLLFTMEGRWIWIREPCLGMQSGSRTSGLCTVLTISVTITCRSWDSPGSHTDGGGSGAEILMSHKPEDPARPAGACTTFWRKKKKISPIQLMQSWSRPVLGPFTSSHFPGRASGKALTYQCSSCKR